MILSILTAAGHKKAGALPGRLFALVTELFQSMPQSLLLLVKCALGYDLQRLQKRQQRFLVVYVTGFEGIP